jgi:leucyl aminopeptidase
VRLVDGLEAMIASNVADAKNFSYDHVSSDLLLSAAFLEPFAGDGPWAHIDIVGTAYRFGPSGVWPAGATGSPTRALISFLEGWAVSPEVLG